MPGLGVESDSWPARSDDVGGQVHFLVPGLRRRVILDFCQGNVEASWMGEEVASLNRSMGGISRASGLAPVVERNSSQGSFGMGVGALTSST